MSGPPRPTFAALAVDYQADAVTERLDAEGCRLMVVMVEVQLGIREEKKRSWPVYEANARARHGAPACVLVVAPDPAVERWARRPMRMGPGGSVCKPLVLGANAVPKVIAAEDALASPELAVLSAVAHGTEGEEGLAIVLAAFAGMAQLPDERANLCYDLIESALGAAARRALEALMESNKYEYRSEFARKYVAQGRAEGKAEGRAEALLTVLRARGLAVTDADQAIILSMREGATLDRWIARAVQARPVDEVLTDDLRD